METGNAHTEELYEQNNVHDVYDKIAAHFSSTRYKPWPVVEDFLQTRAPGSIGLDVGCGNGKYLTVNKNVFIVASDRSPALVKFAKEHQPQSALICDGLTLPHPDGLFDFAISIAVIHHLSTPARRIDAVEAILQKLRSPSPHHAGGQALFFVWALEQKSSRRGWDKGDNQDVMVPWVLQPPKDSQEPAVTYHRYYHLYKQGELEKDVVAAGGKVVKQGYDRDNWWCIVQRP